MIQALPIQRKARAYLQNGVEFLNFIVSMNHCTSSKTNKLIVASFSKFQKC